MKSSSRYSAGRLVRILHVECIIAAVIRDHRQIRFTGEVPQRRFHPKHVLRTVRLPARMSADPRSTYLIAAGKIRCTVLLNVTSKAYGGTIRSNVTGRVSPSKTSHRWTGCALRPPYPAAAWFPFLRNPPFLPVSFPVFPLSRSLCIRTGHTNGKKPIIKNYFFMLVVFS